MNSISVLVTVLGFLLGVKLQNRFKTPLFNPTLVGMSLTGVYLLLSHTPYPEYIRQVEPLQFFLGPAVVALAIPLYRERHTLKRYALPMLLGFAVGGLTALGLGLGVGHLLGLSPEFYLAMGSISVSSPISLSISQKLGFVGSVAATITIITGVIGAMIVPQWLSRLGVKHPIARGLAMGTICHGVGTARMVQEGDQTVAASSIGMGLNGALTAILLPILWHFLG